MAETDIGFSNLPYEIIVKIFSELNVHELRCVVSKVCRSWRTISRDPTLWRRLTVAFQPESSFGSCPKGGASTLLFIKNTPELRIVQLKQFMHKEMTGQILRYLHKYTQELKVLFLSGMLYGNQLSYLPENLEHLQLSGFHGSVDFSVCDTLQKLRRLRIHGELEEDHLRALIPLVPNLTSLRITRSAITAPELILPLKDSLQKLGFNILLCNPTFLEQLGSTFPRLKRLWIKDQAPLLSKLLKLPPNLLRSMRLEETFLSPVFTSKDLATFFNSSVFIQLKQLQLVSSRLDDLGCLAIRTHCPALQSLDVSLLADATLTDDGLVHLLHLSHLTSLDVRFHQRCDWNYRRVGPTTHRCDGTRPCRLNELLSCWREEEVIVVGF